MQRIDELQALAARSDADATWHEDFARSTIGKNRIYHIEAAKTLREQAQRYRQAIMRLMENQK